MEFDPSNTQWLQKLFFDQLTLLDRGFRVRPVHLHPAPSGTTNQKMREYADKIIEKVSHTDPRILLNFVSVDGDEGYNDYLEATFNLLIHFLDRAEFGTPFRDFVLTQLRFWISDWLHVMKNGHVKLPGKKIIVNPQDVLAWASMNGIAKSFEESPTFTDNSPLGKIRDWDPLDLFTLRRAYVLFQRRENMDEFLYIFIMGS
jgi:hypothetical protein